MASWLIVDSNYLAWRAHHSMGQLTFDGKSTGIAFGFLRDIFTFRTIFAEHKPVFCFDDGLSKRKDIYPGYKKKPPMTIEEKEVRNQVYAQINQIRCEFLPTIGFQNIFSQHGYEADDCIASITQNLPKGDKAIIVTADHDLYQLITPSVTVYHPKQQIEITKKVFKQTYGVFPKQWADVKAIAGCVSDKVEGVEGVGEKTACKFLLGRLKLSHISYQRIKRCQDIVERNRGLVTLPLEGVNTFKLVENNTTTAKWEKVLKSLGINSLRHLLH